MTRIEPTPAKPALQTERQVARAAWEHVRLSQRLAAINAAEKDAIDKAKTKAARQRALIEPKRNALLERIQVWAEVNRDGRKTIVLPNGRELKWRKPQSQRLIVNMKKMATIARLLLRFPNWDRYLEVSLKKNNIKADLEELRKVPGLGNNLAVDDTEYFYIR